MLACGLVQTFREQLVGCPSLIHLTRLKRLSEPASQGFQFGPNSPIALLPLGIGSHTLSCRTDIRHGNGKRR